MAFGFVFFFVLGYLFIAQRALSDGKCEPKGWNCELWMQMVLKMDVSKGMFFYKVVQKYLIAI